MALLRYLYARSPRLLILSIITGAVSGLCGAALAVVLSAGISGTAPRASMAAAFFGLCLVYLLAKVGSEIFLIELAQRAIYEMQNQLTRKIIATPLERLQKIGKHGLLALLTKDIDTFMQAGETLPQAFVNAVLICGCIGYMAVLSWQIFLIFIVSFSVCAALFLLAERAPLRSLARIREQSEVLYRHFRALTEGVRELQMNSDRSARFVRDLIARDGLEFKRVFVKSMTGYVFVVNAGTILIYGAIGLCAFFVPLWLPGSAALIAQVVVILLFIIRPVSSLMLILPSLRRSAIALAKIEQLTGSLAGEVALRPAGADPFARPAPLVLELRDIVFRPALADAAARFQLGPLSLSVRAGSVVFLVGGNGSGKTTLALVMLGLYAPSAGSLLLNGVPVTADNLLHYRERFSVVFSDAFLFELVVGPDQASLRERAAEYLQLLQLAHQVEVVGDRFSTVELSSGQRKRLALVAAYLEDRPILLFDEWAAEQEPGLKRFFYQDLLPQLRARGKAVIVVTHDDAYFDRADLVIKLDDGKIRESWEPAPAAVDAGRPALESP